MKHIGDSNNSSDNIASPTTYNRRGIIRISSFETVLAWAFIALAILIFLFGFYTLYSLFSYQRYIPILNMIPGILVFSFVILLCLFFSAQLFASAERLFVLTDIEENTQQPVQESDINRGVEENKGAA
jgi:hypothetical protein